MDVVNIYYKDLDEDSLHNLVYNLYKDCLDDPKLTWFYFSIKDLDVLDSFPDAEEVSAQIWDLDVALSSDWIKTIAKFDPWAPTNPLTIIHESLSQM